MYVHVAWFGPLRHDGLVYKRVLEDEGVEARLDIHPAVTHAFHWGCPGLAVSRRFWRAFPMVFRWLSIRRN